MAGVGHPAAIVLRDQRISAGGVKEGGNVGL